MNEFKCLPDELDKQDNARLLEYLNLKQAVSEIQSQIQKRNKNKSPKHGRH
jgi:hypothetical protein